MKRTKTLTKRERREVKRFQAEFDKQIPKPARKPFKQKEMFKCSVVMKRIATKKAEKAHHRQEKRDAKAGKPHAH